MNCHAPYVSHHWLINYNPGQNIWEYVKKSSKAGQEQKILISGFA